MLSGNSKVPFGERFGSVLMELAFMMTMLRVTGVCLCIGVCVCQCVSARELEMSSPMVTVGC